jgi:hypothetical protein
MTMRDDEYELKRRRNANGFSVSAVHLPRDPAQREAVLDYRATQQHFTKKNYHRPRDRYDDMARLAARREETK